MNIINKKAVKRFIFCLLIITLAAHPQSKLASSRDEIVKQIESYADQDFASKAPLNDQLVISLFQNNQVGLAPLEISQIYRKRYAADQEKAKHWWDKIPGWIYPLLLLLAFLWKPLKESIEKGLGKFYEELYQHHAGAKFFRGTALDRYRESIIRQHLQVKIPFRDKPLAMRNVYVPLRVSEAGSLTGVDAVDTVRNNRGLMIKGNPGSGKSMLLRALLLAYADDCLIGFENDPIPVIIELSRLNDSSTDIYKQLVATFDRYGFPKAERFVTWALDHDSLLLLLDGLDEVNSKERQRVVLQINDLVSKYGCRFVVTCRTQVYRNEFTETADKTLEVAEFSDHDILRFVKAWQPSMKAGQSVEQLMKTLRDRPRILLLARNPLLLTMIAYLYFDQQIALPQSRAEFYRQSTDLLLDKWQGEYNRFNVPAKSAVLSRLAIKFQAKPADDQDRRSLPSDEVLQLVREILPGTTVKLEDAGDLLDEIVDRGGLLLRVDAGRRFQFTHLTMQEYFAATYLAGSRDKVIESFRLDRDTWREVVKLWCGLAQDCTAMVNEVYALEQTTALECLADAKYIEPEAADKILLEARDLLRQSVANPASDPAPKAFGLLASVPGPRGAAMLTWLVEQLKSNDANVQAFAAWALACSNLNYAAEQLFQRGTQIAQEALESMGDVAIHVLTLGNPNIAALVHIGTPRSLEAVASLLWHSDTAIRAHAAANLARRLSDPLVENILRDIRLSSLPDPNPGFEWIWDPFNEPEGSCLPKITAQIASLLWRPGVAQLTPSIDTRICIALYADSKRPDLLTMLPPEVSAQIKERATKLRQPTREDWLRIFQPTTFNLRNSYYTKALLFIATSLALLWIFSIYKAHVLSLPLAWWKAGVIVSGAAPAYGFWESWKTGTADNSSGMLALLFGPLAPPDLWQDFWLKPEPIWKERLGNYLVGLIVVALLQPYPLLVVYFCSVQASKFIGSVTIVAAWSLIYSAALLIYFLGQRKQRLAKNPLHGLLQGPKTRLPKKRILRAIGLRFEW